MADTNALAQFLAEVERRAYRQAVYAVRDEQAALDIVQDAMMKLAEKYCAQPPAEFPMLFQRILQNTIRDYYRRQKVRNFWVTAVSFIASGSDEQEDEEALEHTQAADEKDNPINVLASGKNLALIEAAIEKLPARQREAFLLRYWEEMDIAETAEVMGCSEGSVKTHCSRAVHALAVALQDKGMADGQG
ncbi:MAG: RNA polymerase sigma factor [Sulfuriferula sp.]|nr:RNA polymerase sigma factor [Sulfuriferula sp.]